MATTDNPVRCINLTTEQLNKLLDVLDEAPVSSDESGRRSRRLRYRSQRVPVEIIVGRGETEREFVAASRNISIHGLSILHSESLPKAQTVRLAIPMLDNQEFTVLGRVVRNRKLSNAACEVGIEFVEACQD